MERLVLQVLCCKVWLLDVYSSSRCEHVGVRPLCVSIPSLRLERDLQIASVICFSYWTVY